MLSTQRPRSAPAPSEDARTPATSQNISSNNLSRDWHSSLSTLNRHHEPASLGLSHDERMTVEEHSGNADPWVRKNLLCLDGGGVRGYSTLMILRALMIKIAEIEMEGNSPSSTSVHPLNPRQRRPVQVSPLRIDTLRRSGSPEVATHAPPSACAHYLPAHYFDYLAGTSTGG